MKTFRLSVFWALLSVAPCLAQGPDAALKSPDIGAARALKAAQGGGTPTEIAARTKIGKEYKNLLAWMRGDLNQYLAHFEEIFETKLTRIRRHEEQRLADLKAILAPVRDDPSEVARLTEIHKPHGFVASYSNAQDYATRFVGPKGKLIKTSPSMAEIKLMDAPGLKQLYVDTWAVPFFDTGTQTRKQAKAGVQHAVEVFNALDLNGEISVLEFTRLIALFARPEFDDVRRYKLLPFPSQADIDRYGKERSDARTFGDRYPEEAPVVVNRIVGITPISDLFGERVHLFGLISHSLTDSTADGRIFTSPADFLEHDYAHAFFNLGAVIPGTSEEWRLVHQEYKAMLKRESNATKKSMMKLVYYHFTHESGFRVLNPVGGTPAGPEAYLDELPVIKELILTRFHYDFILKGGRFTPDLSKTLDEAFAIVAPFFKDHFLRIQCNSGLHSQEEKTL